MLKQPRCPRSGYALLMIFCMAAMVSIMLYTQMPRVAFEAQRDKEQLLIDRGEEYTRAVSLFVRKNKKFPPTMEALENTNNIRYLRKKYKDPMTGKDEWRVIHVGPNGVFTDSHVYGKKDKNSTEKQTFITELAPIGGTASTDPGVNLATRKRQSDGPNAPGTGDAIAGDPNAPPQGTPAAGGMQVLPDGRVVPIQSGNPNANGQPPAGSLPPGVQLPAGIGAQQQPNGLLPGQPGAPATSPTAGTYSTAPGANGQTQPPFGQQPGTTGAASDLIRNLLTSPRPGGQFGTPAAQSASAGQTTIGGGIAGVASNKEREGIKVYKEKSAYNDWEFVYDMSKDPAMANNGAGQGGQRQPGQPGQPNQPGQPGQTAPPVQTIPTRTQ